MSRRAPHAGQQMAAAVSSVLVGENEHIDGHDAARHKKSTMQGRSGDEISIPEALQQAAELESKPLRPCSPRGAPMIDAMAGHYFARMISPLSATARCRLSLRFYFHVIRDFRALPHDLFLFK